MGKATIVSNQGAGLYTVKLEYSGLDGAIAQIEARRAALEARISQLETELTQTENAQVQAKQAAESLLNDWLAGVPVSSGEGLVPQWSEATMQYAQEASEAMKVPEALINAIGNVQKASMATAIADNALNTAYAEYLSVTTREAELGRLKNSSDATISAWCADCTEDLAGTVATMEIPGEATPKLGGGVNIRPGYFDRAVWSAVCGQLQHATILSEAGFAWNFTMIQPWLKWMPLWRYGTVTGKDEDNNTLDVSLHPILSKAGAWLAKQTDFNDPWDTSMTGVPAEYMSCGAAVFEPDDEVVVEFRAGGGGDLSYYEPYVIGFKDNPRPCEFTAILVEWNTGQFKQLVLVVMNRAFQVVEIRFMTNPGQTYGAIRVSLRSGLFWWSSYFIGGHRWLGRDDQPLANLPTLQNDFKKVEMANSGWRRWIAAFGADENSNVLKTLTLYGHDLAGVLQDTIALQSNYYTNDMTANGRFVAISIQTVPENSRDPDYVAFEYAVQVVDLGETPGVVSPSLSSMNFRWSWRVSLSDDNVLAVADFVDAKVYLYQLPGWTLIGQLDAGTGSYPDAIESGTIWWYYTDVNITRDYLVVIKTIGRGSSAVDYYKRERVEWYRRPDLSTPAQTMDRDQVPGLPPTGNTALVFKFVA